MPERERKEIITKDVLMAGAVVGGLYLLSKMVIPKPKPEAKTVEYMVTVISEDLKRKMEEPDKYCTEDNFKKNKSIYDSWKPEFEKYGITLPVRDWDKLSLVDKNQQIKVDLIGAFKSYWDKAGLEPKGYLDSVLDKVFGIVGIAAMFYIGAKAIDIFNWYMQRRPPKKEPTSPTEPLPAPPAPSTPATAPKVVYVYDKYKLYDDKTYSANEERYPITTATLDKFYYIDKKLWGAAFVLYWGHPYEYYYPDAAPKTPEATPPAVTPESPPSITDKIAAWIADKLGTTKEWILTHPLEVSVALAAVGALWILALLEPTPAGEAVMTVVTPALIGILTPLGMPKAAGKPKGYVAGYSIEPLAAEAGQAVNVTITVKNIGDGTGNIKAVVRREDLKVNVIEAVMMYNPQSQLEFGAAFTMPANDVQLSFEAQTQVDTEWVVDSKRTDMVKYKPTEQWKEATYTLDMLLHGWYEKKEFLDEYCVGLYSRSYENDTAGLTLYKGCVFTGFSKGGVYLYTGCQLLWRGELKPGQEVMADDGKVKLKYNGGGSVTMYKKIS